VCFPFTAECFNYVKIDFKAVTEIRILRLTYSDPLVVYTPLVFYTVRNFHSFLRFHRFASETQFFSYSNIPPMATKRKCEDDKPMVQSAYALRVLLYSSIFFHGSPEIALLHIMEEHNFSLRDLVRSVHPSLDFLETDRVRIPLKRIT
jgi:hypothetical protein